MNVDDLEARVLGHTRREMAPTLEDASRAREALTARLGAATLGEIATAGASKGWWGGLGPLKTLVIVAALGGAGVVIALPDDTEEAPRSVAPPKPPKLLSVRKFELENLPPPPSPPVSASRTESPSRRSAPAPSTPAPKEPRNHLAEEVRLLKRADQALRHGTPRVARELLEELSASYPNGQLLEERAATATLLSCQERRDETARTAARAFLSAHPASVYAPRIRVACFDSTSTE